MALQSVFTQWGWKLMGEADPGQVPVGYLATPGEGEVIIRANAPTPEVLAAAAAQPTISMQQWNDFAAVQNPLAFVMGERLAVERAAAPAEIAAPVKTGASVTDTSIIGGIAAGGAAAVAAAEAAQASGQPGAVTWAQAIAAAYTAYKKFRRGQTTVFKLI
jgi:hypothetical protein